MNRCNICLEKKCPSNHSCNCETCTNQATCPKYLHPTIRITTKCTQKCGHCCFSCSPEKKDMMSVETAKSISQFLHSNDIFSINVMGGEFFMNPDWYEILHILSDGIPHVRLVSNGDWAGSNALTAKVVEFLTTHSNFKLNISYDRWHTNAHVAEAIEICEQNNILFILANEEQTKEDSIVPIGNAVWEYNWFSSFGRYCLNPAHMYSFMIDENGEIYKCPFGMVNYSDIFKHLNGGFDEAFQQFTKAYLSVFFPNCTACIRSLQGKSFKENFYRNEE